MYCIQDEADPSACSLICSGQSSRQGAGSTGRLQCCRYHGNRSCWEHCEERGQPGQLLHVCFRRPLTPAAEGARCSHHMCRAACLCAHPALGPAPTRRASWVRSSPSGSAAAAPTPPLLCMPMWQLRWRLPVRSLRMRRTRTTAHSAVQCRLLDRTPSWGSSLRRKAVRAVLQ